MTLQESIWRQSRYLVEWLILKLSSKLQPFRVETNTLDMLLLIMLKYVYVVLHVSEYLCHILICHVWKVHLEYIIKCYILSLNFKGTLMCRPLVLAWKKSSNKVSRSQREQVWTSSTILFQISNFDSKLHLIRRSLLSQKGMKIDL